MTISESVLINWVNHWERTNSFSLQNNSNLRNVEGVKEIKKSQLEHHNNCNRQDPLRDIKISGQKYENRKHIVLSHSIPHKILFHYNVKIVILQRNLEDPILTK